MFQGYNDALETSKNYYGVVYKLTNLLNGKSYIGHTTNLKRRFNNYKIKNIESKQYSIHRMTKVVHSIGFENFRLDILDTASSIEDLSNKELQWIFHYKTHIDEYGYNHTTTPQYLKIESRNKLSTSNKKFRHTEEEKIRRSIPVYLYKDGFIKKYISAKVVGDIISAPRTNVTRAIKTGGVVRGYMVFYCDYELRQKIINNIQKYIKNKQSFIDKEIINTKKKYIKIAEFIDKDVEINEQYIIY